MAGSPIQPSSRLVIVMQTWIAPIALAGLALSVAIAAAARLAPRARSASTCAGRVATTAYSLTTKNAFSPISSGTAAREVQSIAIGGAKFTREGAGGRNFGRTFSNKGAARALRVLRAWTALHLSSEGRIGRCDAFPVFD